MAKSTSRIMKPDDTKEEQKGSKRKTRVKSKQQKEIDDVDEEISKEQSIGKYEDEEPVVQMFNDLLFLVTEDGQEATQKPKQSGAGNKESGVSNAAQLLAIVANTPLYACICEKFIGSRLDGLIRTTTKKKQTKTVSEDRNNDIRIHNMRIVLSSMEQNLLKMDLSHIDAGRIIEGVWEDNRNLIELLFFIAEREKKKKAKRRNQRQAVGKYTSNSDESSKSNETGDNKNVVLKGAPTVSLTQSKRPSWKPSTCGKISPCFESYRSDSTIATTTSRKKEEQQEVNNKTATGKDNEVMKCGEGDDGESKAALNEKQGAVSYGIGTSMASKNKLIRLKSHIKKNKGKAQNKTSMRAHGTVKKQTNLDTSSVLLDDSFNSTFIIPSQSKKHVPSDIIKKESVVGTQRSGMHTTTTTTNQNPNDESVASVFSLLNTSLTNFDLSTVYDSDNYLHNLTQNSNVVSKITHLIKLFQAQRKGLNANEELNSSDVPLKYQNELSRLSKASSLRKKIWIKDRMIDNKVQNIKKKRRDQIVRKNKMHQKKVDEIFRKRFLEEVESRKRYELNSFK